jgi:NTE family protein
VSGPPNVAFVLGGGGVLGAHEVGMLRALCEAGIQPDAVIGTSVGAVNGALVAAGFSPDAVTHLANLWTSIGDEGVFGGSVLARMSTLVRSRTHLHSNERLRALLEQHLPVSLIEELAVPFQCVAASVERAGAHWFSSGPLVDAVLASAAVPGLLPPVEIDGEHYLDGGEVAVAELGGQVARFRRVPRGQHVHDDLLRQLAHLLHEAVPPGDLERDEPDLPRLGRRGEGLLLFMQSLIAYSLSKRGPLA